MTSSILRRNTPRKKALAHLLVTNAATPSPLSMQEMMERAGYAPSTARARHVEIMRAVRQEPEVQDHLGRLVALRSKMLDRMEATVATADFRSVGMAFAILEKSIRVLEDKVPERRGLSLSDTEQEILDSILEENE